MKKFKEYIFNLCSITENQWNDFEEILSLKRLSSNEYFIKPGSTSGEIGFILKGVLRHYIIDELGNEITTDFCVADEFTGLPNPFIQSDNNPYSIEALTESELIVFSPDRLDSFFEKHPNLKSVLNSIMIEYIDLKCNRERDLLSFDAKGRYLQFLKRFPGLDIPQYYIASYLGVTPETLSRLKSKLI